MVSTGMFLFLLIYFIYYEIKNWRLKFYYSYDFYLSKQEEKEYNSLKKKFNDILLNAKKVENSLLSYLVQGRSVKKNVFYEDKYQTRAMLPLSLSYDHRIIDGAEAARFCNDLKENLGKSFAYKLAV